MKSVFIDSVQKSYWLNQVLTDVFLKLEAGEIIGLVGRNGSGKSTLLKIMFGSLHADFKFLRINDQKHNKAFLKKGTITYLPQDNFIPGHLRVFNAVRQFLRDSDFSSALLSDDILSKVSNEKVQNLSGGELRYLEVKLIIHKKSDFTLLDEPFNGISPLQIELVKQDIMIKAKEGKGIIITDHDYRNVINFSDRIVLIHDGGTKQIENPAELIAFGYLPEKSLNSIIQKN